MILEYYVMKYADGVTMWLADDEQTWTPHFYCAASFTTAQLANEIGHRQLRNEQTFYVMGCMCSEQPSVGSLLVCEA